MAAHAYKAVWLQIAQLGCCVLLQVPVMQHAPAMAQQDTFPGKQKTFRHAHTADGQQHVTHV
jgi:hypothetical protein